MQAIGVKTTVKIDNDPTKGGTPFQPPAQAASAEAGKPSLIVEEGKGSSSVRVDSPGQKALAQAGSTDPNDGVGTTVGTVGTVMAEGTTIQPPLGNTRIHIQEGRQVQEVRDTRTRVRIHEPAQGGTVIAEGVVVHAQQANPDPHGRTRVSIVEPGQRVGIGSTSVTHHEPVASFAAPETPATLPSPPSEPSTKKRARGARGGRRSKKKVAAKKVSKKASKKGGG